MSEHDGLLRAILDDPDDETRRRVYADWLDDNGDPDRAAFVRAQLDQDRVARGVPYLDDWHWQAYRDGLWTDLDDWGREAIHWMLNYRDVQQLVADDADAYLEHKAPADGLLQRHLDRWTPGVAAEFGFRRGLPERAILSQGMLAGDAAEFFREAPVLDLTLTECDAGLYDVLKQRPLSRLTHLQVAACPTHGVVAEAVARAKHLKRLTSLWLQRCYVTDESLRALSRCRHLAGLTELRLDGNHGVTAEGVRALTTSPYLKRLRALSLCGAFEVGPEGAALLAGWPGLAGVATLDLSQCGIGVAGVAALSASPHAASLRTLLLSTGTNPELVQALASSASLRGLTFLELGGGSDEGVRTLVNSDVVANLRYLGLSGESMSYEGAPAIAASPRLRNLKALSLRGQDVWADGLNALFTSPHMRLWWLDVSDNNLNSDAMQDLPAAPTMGSLAHLLLDDNPIGDKGVALLARWPGMGGVSALGLEETGMRTPGVKALLSSPHCQCLLKLNAWHNRIGAEGKKLLRERFPHEGCLHLDD